MYSFSYLEPVCCSMSSFNCCFLTYIQISQEAGQVLWYYHLFQNFPQFIVIHTVKGFGIVNKAEIDVFLELSCFFDDSVDVGNLISGSSAFSKTSLNIWKFMAHVLLKPGMENFEHYFTRVWDECNCTKEFQKKQENSRKTSTSALLIMPKPLTVWITINYGKFWKRWEYQTTWPASWETSMQVRKQQLELDMEQWTGSK